MNFPPMYNSDSILIGIRLNWVLNMGQPLGKHPIMEQPGAEGWDGRVYMIPWGCPFPAIFFEHSSNALWMSLAQEIWDLIMLRYCA